MILIKILPPNILLKRTYSSRKSNVYNSVKLRALMSKVNESLVVKSPGHSNVKTTLASNISLKIIGSGARGAPTCVCLYTNETRYFFNCGESTQRVNNEHKNKLCRLSKIDNVFITTPIWKNIGGLPGLLLCLQSYGVSNVNVHGPFGTVDVVDAMKRFVYLKKLNVTEGNVNEPFVDNVLTINYVPLKTNRENDNNENIASDINALEDNVDYYAHESSKAEKRKIVMYGDNVKRVKRESQRVTGRIKTSMCYIGKIHPRKGRLNLVKCVEKGVKPGPMLGELKRGKDITLPDGTVVKSTDVVNPPDPGSVFIVVDCPRTDLLESLINNPIFRNYQSGSAPSKDMVARCVVHFTPESILRDERYKKWMETFGFTTQHMIVNETNTCLGTEAVHRVQHQLHLLHDSIFPFLDQSNLTIDVNQDSNSLKNMYDDSSDTEPESSNENNVDTFDESPLVHRVKTLHSFGLYPRKGLITNSEVKIYPRVYVNELFQIEGFLDALAELQTNVNAMTKKLGNIPEYPKLVILGTSSTSSTKLRNTSGLLLRIDEERSILMDCGEGTVNQLFKIYGEKTGNVLSTIKAVYISHLHADHHLGLIGILQERSRSTKEPIYLLAPYSILSWLHFYNIRYEPISDSYTLISNDKLTFNQHGLSQETERMLYDFLQVQEISTVSVNHCVSSFGVAVTLRNGQKIIYSGDTMPCENLVELGQNCDLLIHEATMGDNSVSNARLKLHSTVSQAIEAGEKMKAKFTLLTHFSQRFAKTFFLPEIEGYQDCSKIGLAFDNMHIKLAELPILPLFYPCLQIWCYSNNNVIQDDGIKTIGRSKSQLQKDVDKLESV